MRIYRNFKESNSITLFNGDCRKLLKRLPDESVDLVVTSPPYCIGKAYEDPHDDIETFRKQHQDIFSDLYRVVKPGGSICWQIGYHVSDKCVVPLDYIIYDIFTSMSEELDNPLILRNRIVWTFGHGLNSTTRFSGRHEMILWFTKGLQTIFNLDEVRIPQKYPGKRFYKGPNKGQLSGNPMGKNPSDVWDIPNVKAKHIEKTDHPCQFPVAIPQRLIKALTNKNGLVLDPFMGSGTTGVAALIEGRRFVGSEIQKSYFDISVERIKDASDGKAKIREDGLYVSKEEVSLSEDEDKLFSNLIFIQPKTLNYFQWISQCIKLSARNEIFRFLNIKNSDIGNISSSNADTKITAPIIYPRSFTGLKNGVRIVSFMMSAEDLLNTCYVLRKDNWSESIWLYQRLIEKGKIKNIRNFLASKGAAFYNNIIVALPDTVARCVSEPLATLYARQWENQNGIYCEVCAQIFSYCNSRRRQTKFV